MTVDPKREMQNENDVSRPRIEHAESLPPVALFDVYADQYHPPLRETVRRLARSALANEIETTETETETEIKSEASMVTGDGDGRDVEESTRGERQRGRERERGREVEREREVER